MNICIFGSCVSRDVFRYATDINLAEYFARSSIISAVSEAIPIKDNQIKLNSEFQRRIVGFDFNKTFTTFDPQDSFLLLDLIEERFDVMRYGNSFVTGSNEFFNAKLNDLLPFERIARSEIHDKWISSFEKFFSLIIEKFGLNRIILHKVSWCTYYYEQGQKIDFDARHQNWIFRNNKLLETYQSWFANRLPTNQIIDLDCNKYGADKNHMWGLEPYHYTESYYKDVVLALKRVKHIFL